MTPEQQRAALLVVEAGRTYMQVRDAWMQTPMVDGEKYDRLNRIRSKAWQRLLRREETEAQVMGEDMTYQAEPTRAQLAARVQELERENAELRARLDAVPVAAIERYIGVAFDDTKSEDEDELTIALWLSSQGVQP